MGSVGEGGYVPSAKSAEEESVNQYLVMENIVDKLKVLDYESLFCKKQTSAALMRPLTRSYFAMPQKNANEQFYYFTSLVSWLMNLSGNNFPAPGQFEDPNTTCANIVDQLKKIGLVTDFAPIKLKDGWGEAICSVLNKLTDYALEKQNFKFQQPIHKASKTQDVIQEEGEEDEIVVADETIVDDEDAVDYLETEESTPESDERAYIHSTTDAANWKLEVERVSSKLRIYKSSDHKDWRTHLERMKANQKNINSNIGDAKNQLTKMAIEIGQTLEKVQTREKIINEQFTSLVEEFRGLQEQLTELNTKYNEANKRVAELANEMQSLTEELVKQKREQNRLENSSTDTTPVTRMKEALEKLKEEIAQFDVRIGVVEHSILRTRIRAKKNSRVFGTVH